MLSFTRCVNGASDLVDHSEEFVCLAASIGIPSLDRGAEGRAERVTRRSLFKADEA